MIRDTLYQYYILVRLDKPIGIFLLLWPTLWALWIAAEGLPDLLILFVFVLGVIIMRSAGCVINDYADRNIDPFIERTYDRPIAAGRIAPHAALNFFLFLITIAFLLVLLMNWQTISLAFVGLGLAAGYPFLKRYTYLPQVGLGAAFGWAVPMAFAAQTGSIPQVAWLLFVATVLWATAYDTMYAMVDREDDIRIGVKSTAILFGDMDKLIIGIIQVLMFTALLLAGRQQELGIFYYLGLTVASGFAVYQQYLIRNRESGQCFEAFLNNHYLGLTVFSGVVLNYSFTG
ncbi:MAG: 4-hydroxybenzoate octaprenyltransferase [Gammaproteobacteria bacterium]|nr:4-hydroxybenzoate octaprenyltransferase [Gammaproteobacteria bacterium]MCK5090913.1 4-hydroxybenzoate octaprenyltransferase [Gammaproteobacteria bacterium]